MYKIANFMNKKKLIRNLMTLTVPLSQFQYMNEEMTVLNSPGVRY